MSLSSMFKKNKQQETEGQYLVEPGAVTDKSNKTNEKKQQTFDDLPQAGDFSENGKQEFAEIYGSALVGRRQNFILGLFGLFIGAIALFWALTIASTKIAIPWFVEVDKQTGSLSKPIRIENLTPNQAVIRSTLASLVEKCFTIDPQLSPIYQRECARMAMGRAVEQLRAFRVEHEIMTKVAKGNELRFAKTRTVDLTQNGVAFIYLTTTEIDSNGQETNPQNYRVRLDYTSIPPKNEDEVIQNPLGIFITLFNPILER